MPANVPVDRLVAYNVSRESLAKLEAYVSLLLQWQRRFNLIGPSTTETIWNRHILDAVQVLPLFSKGVRSIADLGSGAGIPGLALSMAGNLDAHLYESNGKKAAFLREAIRQTGAKAHVHQVRLENLPIATDIPKVDVVLARALAPLTQLLGLAQPFIASGARAFFHKGQDIEAELTEASKYWRLSFTKHSSHTDSRGVIFEVLEAVRVR